MNHFRIGRAINKSYDFGLQTGGDDWGFISLQTMRRNISTAAQRKDALNAFVGPQELSLMYGNGSGVVH